MRDRNDLSNKQIGDICMMTQLVKKIGVLIVFIAVNASLASDLDIALTKK
jgi:hypothetical protein